MRWLDGVTDSMDMGLSKLLEIVKYKGSLAWWRPWGHEELDMTEGPNNSNNLFCYWNITLKAVTKCLYLIVCKGTHSLDLYVILYKRGHATSLVLQLIF